MPRKDVASEYDCECEEGFEGDYCDTKIITACQSNPCQHGGTCNEVGGTFKCTCVDNFEGNSCTEFKYPGTGISSNIYIFLIIILLSESQCASSDFSTY